MNWDYKHSLSIQIERQRCNISCGLRRWQWFTLQGVAASFHYLKVLWISMVLEMTNSPVQEERGGWDFFQVPVNVKLAWGFAACVAQSPEFCSRQASLHWPSTVSAIPPHYLLTFRGHQLLYWHLLEWRITLCYLGQIEPVLSLLPFEGSYRQALKILWSLTVD